MLLSVHIDRVLRLELSNSATRQFEFAERMNGYMRIRSPALERTLERGSEQHKQFLSLKRTHRSQDIILTLDTDVVWHTHLRSGQEHRRGMMAILGHCANHDDTINHNSALTASSTRRSCTNRFNETYGIFSCWICELLPSEMKRVERTAELVGWSARIDAGAVQERVERIASDYRAAELLIRYGRSAPRNSWSLDGL